MNYIKIIVILVLSSSILFTSEINAKTYFDIKTKLSEKTDLMAAKAGTMIFIMASDWAGIKEVGEDYSLWLKNYKKKIENSTITIEFDIEIRTAALLRSGSLLAEDKVKISFKSEEDWHGVESITKAIEMEMKNKSREIKKEALFIGAEVEKVLKRIIKKVKN